MSLQTVIEDRTAPGSRVDASQHLPAEHPVRRRALYAAMLGALIAGQGIAQAADTVTGTAADTANTGNSAPQTPDGAAPSAPVAIGAAAAARVLDDVVVTAERREAGVQQVAGAITVIKGTDVTDLELRNAKDVIRFVPNMNADTTDGHMRPKWYIRGIGRSDASLQSVSQVGIYYDDVYIQNASSTGFPLFDLERVEVLRGPQGTLWGKNTIGGAVNFISRKPTFDPEGYAKISYGDWNETLLEGAYGGSLKDGVLAARVSTFQQESDLYIQNSFIPGNEGWSENANRVQLLANLGDVTDVLLNLHHRKFEGPQLRSFNATNPAANPHDVPSLINAETDFVQKGTTLTLNHAFEGADLVSISAYDEFERKEFGGDQVTYESARTAGGFDLHQVSQEVRLSSSSDNALSWIVGGHYFTEDLSSRTINGNLPGSRTATGAARAQSYRIQTFDLDTRSASLFGSLTYAVTDRLDLTGGVRRTRESKSIDLLARAAAAGFSFGNVGTWYDPWLINGNFNTNASQLDDRTWSATTYDLTARYELRDNLRSYFRYAKGFNSGNYNANAATQAAVGVLDPEHLKSYELGLKSEWWDSRLQLNGAVFYYDYTDIHQNVMSLNDFGVLINTSKNAGAGWSKGGEIELRVLPLEGLELSINAGYTAAKFSDFQATPDNNVAGNWFNRVPRWTSNLAADYEIPLPSGALRLSTDWAIRSFAYFNAVEQADPWLVQPGYSVGNASVAWISPDETYQVRVFANNVSDKVYKHTQTLGSTGSSYAPPRTYGISLTARF